MNESETRRVAPWKIGAGALAVVALTGGGLTLALGGSGDDESPATKPARADETTTTVAAGPADPAETSAPPREPTDSTDAPAGDGAGSQTPEDVVDAFIAAARAGECEQMMSLVSEDAFQGQAQGQDGALAQCQAMPETVLEVWGDMERAGPAQVDGDTATVDLASPSNGDGTIQLTVVRQDDSWLIGELGAA